MFDIFYIGPKPNLFPFEKEVNNITEAQQLTRTDYCWIVNTYNDYSGWDFLWQPDPWEATHQHVFPSQWQRDSGTYLIPKQEITDVNYRTECLVTRQRPTTDVVLIDHLDNNVSNAKILIENKVKIAKTTKFVDNYLDTLIRIANTATSEYIWVCSSVCNYTDFDFTWHPEPWQQEMLHVFPSGEQKFGDTFYMHVPTFKKNAPQCQLLDWYNNNFCNDQRVPRYKLPVVHHKHDSHVSALPERQQEPLVVYSNTHMWYDTIPDVALWRKETRTILPVNKRGSTVIVPRDAIGKIKEQLWDYEFVAQEEFPGSSDPLDVIFLENGEVNAEENWNHLKDVALAMKPNKLKRVTGVKGRVNAYRAAAEASTTPWFYCVFAKLKIDQNFDFSWQPDCLQQAKHYIFHAENPINGLKYGHMAMIAYNKKLVLENTAPGLDFTLDQAHEVVPMLSGVANYADDTFMAWRTAFREVLKLKHQLSKGPDVDTDYRLRVWLTRGEGDKGEWSKIGATDAVEYYQEVNGDFDKLKLSYDWDWLTQYFHSQNT